MKGDVHGSVRILVLFLVSCRAPPPSPDHVVPHDAAMADAAAITQRPDASIAVDTISIETPSQTPGRHPRAPSTAVNTASDLDGTKVRHVIKGHFQELLACFALTSPSDLPRVEVQFTIGPDGKVQSSSASGARATVDVCIADAFKRFEFPKPASGGSLDVTYPLHFDRFAGQ